MKGFLMFLLGLVVGAVSSWLLTDLYYVAHPQWRHTETVYDTLRYEMPVVRDSMVVRYVVRRLPKAPGAQLPGDGGCLSSEEGTTATEVAAPHLLTLEGGEDAEGTEAEGNTQAGSKSKTQAGSKSKTQAGSSASLVEVVVPIEEKVYEDSTYRIRISGYEPRLEEVEIYRQTRTVTATEKPKRWHVGVSAGAGICGKGVVPYIGVGVTYSIFDF